MDVNQLRHELAQGIRLPKPEYCPDNIPDIIQRCFHEDPKDRPDFIELKVLIETAYDLLISCHNGSEVSNQESEMLLYENIASTSARRWLKMSTSYRASLKLPWASTTRKSSSHDTSLNACAISDGGDAPYSIAGGSTPL